MARGWESKSVESQIEDRRDALQPRTNLSREELERARKRESLESSRRGVVRELENSRSPVLRAALEQALKHLDEEIGKL